MKKLIGFLSVALLVWLMAVGTASAAQVTVPLSDFVIFSGGGATLDIQSNFETWIGGHTTINGNIGSNQDLQLNGGPLPGYPAQINGSVYVGGFLLTGQYTIGTSLVPQQIVVNGATDNGAPPNTYEADLGGLLYGNLFATSELMTGLVVNLNSGILPNFGITGNVEITGAVPSTSCPECTTGVGGRVGGTVTRPSTKTFALITMPPATDLTTFVDTQGPQQVPSGPGFLTLAPNTITTGYGALTTSAQNQTINLSSGSYYFESIDTDGGLTLNIDLTSGQCIKIYVLNDALFNLTTLKVKGTGTGGSYLPISDPNAQALAGLIYLETQGVFQLGPGGTAANPIIWGGTVYASSRVAGEAYIDVRQYVEWYGAAWSYDSFNTLDHGKWTYKPLVPCDGQAKARKSGYKFDDLNENGVWDNPGELALPGWTITLYDANQNFLDTRVTDADGFYEFADLEPGTYVVCETQQPNWTQTFPVTGTGVVSCLSGGLGYRFTLDPGDNHTDNNFGNFQAAFCCDCDIRTALDPTCGRFLGNKGFDVVVRPDLGQSIQDVLDTVIDYNGDGFIIVGVTNGTYGSTSCCGTVSTGAPVVQNVKIYREYDKPFGLFGCNVTLSDPDPDDGIPTAWITPDARAPVPAGGTGNIFVMGLHGADSKYAGWLVEGDGRYLQNVNGIANVEGAVGLWFLGNNNTLQGGTAEGNAGIGILVEGDWNKVDSVLSSANGLQGIFVAGNGNTVSNSDSFANGRAGIAVIGNDNKLLSNYAGNFGQGNAGDGINVLGAGNRVDSNRALANGGDGINVAGGIATSPNILFKNIAGTSGRGNVGNGIVVSGLGNGIVLPIEIQQNMAQGNGLRGFWISGSGHQLRMNISGGSLASQNNGGWEYEAATGNINALFNKANGVTIPGTNGSAFPSTAGTGP